MASIELYKQEVKQLTDLLRNEWDDIRTVAINNDLDPQDTFLLSFIEDEDENETCLFYQKEKGLFLYEKNNGSISFNQVQQADIENDFPQVQVLNDLENFDTW